MKKKQRKQISRTLKKYFRSHPGKRNEIAKTVTKYYEDNPDAREARAKGAKEQWESYTKKEKEQIARKRSRSIKRFNRLHPEKNKERIRKSRETFEERYVDDEEGQKKLSETKSASAKKQWERRTKKEKAKLARKIGRTVKKIHAAPGSVYKSEETIKRQKVAGKRNYDSGKNRKGLEIGWDHSNPKIEKKRRAGMRKGMKRWFRNMTDAEYEVWITNVVKGTRLFEHTFPNKTEAALGKLIEPLGFRYTGNKTFWIGRANPDFVNEKLKLVVELFGRYYHKDKEKDRKRIAKIRKAGWKVLVIWDDLFRKNPARQAGRVKKFVDKYS